LIIKKLIYSHEKCPDYLLVEGIKDENWEIRLICAKNNNCPVEVLMVAAQDKNYLIRKEVLKNKNITLEILLKVKEDPIESVRKVAEEVLDYKFKHDLTFIARGI
jgi:hypothetical protein